MYKVYENPPQWLAICEKIEKETVSFFLLARYSKNIINTGDLDQKECRVVVFDKRYAVTFPEMDTKEELKRYSLKHIDFLRNNAPQNSKKAIEDYT